MDLKRISKFLVLVTSFTLIFYLSWKIYSGIENKNEIAEKTEILPDFNFYTLYGERFLPNSITKGNSSVIIFFNPDCHHCTCEIEGIIKNSALFSSTDILLVSDQPAGLLKQFSEQYDLDNFPQIKILYADYGHIRSVFGTIFIPATFIYCEDHSLLKTIKGEVSAEAILKILSRK
jgi:peroxiredoxin